MKFTDFEFGIGRDFNDKFWSKIFSDTSRETHNVSLELTEEGKIKEFSCTCKGATIATSMGKELKCKHMKRLEEVIKLMGCLE